MDKEQDQILINQITIMEALIALFREIDPDRNFCARRNLELRCGDTYQLLRKDRQNGNDNQENMRQVR